MRLIWYPPNGDDGIELTSDPYVLQRIQGLTSVPASPRTERGPGQIGATPIDTLISERVIDMTVLVAGSTDQDIWEFRNSLARAFVALPTEDGSVEVGTLRIERASGLPLLEIAAQPRSTPEENDQLSHFSLCDIELLCPDPFFKEIADHVVRLETEGGFEFPVEHPFEIIAFNVEAEVTNGGDIPVPITARLYGECDTPRLTNVTTGESIEVEGTVDAGDYVSIQTGFGLKSIELVHPDGTRENIMDRLNLAEADFFRLARGVNVLRFSAATNTSGNAIVNWREQYAGI